MNGFVCLDSSVLVKLLTWEEGSEAAAALMDEIVEKGQKVALPGFAWAEVGSVLRQKVKRNEITAEEAEEAWQTFHRLKVVTYLDGEEAPLRAWRISVAEDLPTLYDAAYLAVTELNGDCEFWTADERLVSILKGRKKYIKSLRADWQPRTAGG